MSGVRIKVTCPHGFVIEAPEERAGSLLMDLCARCATENRPVVRAADRGFFEAVKS